MKKKIIVLVILITALICSCYIFFKIFKVWQPSMLNSNEYLSIYLWGDISISDENAIKSVVDLLNSNIGSKTLKPVDTLQSPEFLFELYRKDGKVDKIFVYGGVYENRTFIHYNDAQYTLKNPKKLYREIEHVMSRGH